MDSHDIEAYFRQHRRLLAVLLMIIGMAAVSGVFMGMRQTASETTAHPEEANGAANRPMEGVLPAPRYGEISNTPWHANADWKFTLDQLPQAKPDRQPQVKLTATELLEVLQVRSERRAFDGAPPVVPHEIDPISSASCVVCHGKDATALIAGKRPPAMSHAYYANCTQCHAPANGLRKLTEQERLVVASAFEGRARPGPGCRAHATAPPTMPHPVFMRENCASCHDPSRPYAIRSSHADRQNCLQCHAQNAGFDNRERWSNTPPAESP